MKNSNTRSYLKLSEVQYYLGISKQTLDNMILRGEIPYVCVRGVRYIPSNAFFSWLETYSLGGAA